MNFSMLVLLCLNQNRASITWQLSEYFWNENQN